MIRIQVQATGKIGCIHGLKEKCKEKEGPLMVLKNNKKSAAQKERRRQERLNLALILLLISLFLFLTLGYFYIKTGNLELTRSDVAPPAEKDNANVYFELLEPSDRDAVSPLPTTVNPEIPENRRFRDEFQPTMESLFKERELIKSDIERYFTNRRPFTEINPMHTTGGKEVVYIYHSHSREAFLPYLKNTDKPEEAYHATANITLVGKMLEEALERRGIGTQVDASDIGTELDARGLNYGSSYPVSREHVQGAQKENRNLEVFLDLHRDSLRKDSTTTDIEGKEFAQLLFVVGTGHAEFRKNLSFTAGLHQEIEGKYPGLSKGILEKDSSQGNGIYNQDISPQSVIVEVGGVDNTAEELNRTVEAFADVLSDYYWHGEK